MLGGGSLLNSAHPHSPANTTETITNLGVFMGIVYHKKTQRAHDSRQGASPFFTHAYWDLETTKTTFKNNIVLRTHLEHSESWQFEDRQMGAGELARAPMASCFK